MSLLGALAVNILGDISGVRKSFEDLDQISEKTGSSLGQKLAAGAKIAVAGIAGLAAGVAAGATAMIVAANKAASYADEIDKMSIRTGLARGTLQELRFICDQAGASFGSIETASKGLTMAMDQVRQGTGTAADSFAELGVEIYDGSGKMRQSNDVMSETLLALAAMEDPTRRNQIALDLFSRAGMDLIPVLDAGVDGIKDMTAQAHSMGLVMTDEGVASLVSYQDSMSAVKQAISAVTREVTMQFLPILTRLLDWIKDHMPAIQAVVQATLGNVGKAIAWLADTILPYLVEAWEWIRDTIIPLVQKLWSSITEMFTQSGDAVQSKWGKIWDNIQVILKTIWAIIVEVCGIIQRFWAEWGDTILAYAKLVWDHIVRTVETAINLIKSIVTLVLALLKGDWSTIWESIKDIASTVWNWLAATASAIFGFLRDLVGTIWDKMKTKAEDVWDGVKQYFVNLWTGIKNVFTQGIEDIVDWFSSLPERVMQSVTSLVDKVIGGFTGLFKKLVGGSIVPEMWDAIVSTTEDGVDNVVNSTAIGLKKAADIWVDYAVSAENAAKAAEATVAKRVGTTLEMISSQQAALLSAGDITGALALQEVLVPGYKAPKVAAGDVTARALDVAEGLHGAFPDKVVDFSTLMDILRKDPNADFGAIQKAVIGLAEGGIVTKPTHILAGEKGKPEAVIPLEKLGGLGGDTYNVTVQVRADDIRSLANLIDLFEGLKQTARAMGVGVVT